MFEGYLAQQPTAVWNIVRGVWEKPGMVSLLCEHLEPFSETWPSGGTMRNGRVWKRQTPEHHIEDFESSSSRVGGLPTPVTTDWNGAASDYGIEGFRQLRDIHNILGGFYDVPNDCLLATPTTGEVSGPSLSSSGGENLRTQVALLSGKDLPIPFALLRTPAASEAERGHQPEDKARARGGQVTLSGQVNYAVDFGRFQPSIRRWEVVTKNPAPSPTKPNGKDGAQRLSSEFTEWMMGLQPGWVTGLGLSRKDELKACGNGVVPQQAELALQILKGRM